MQRKKQVLLLLALILLLLLSLSCNLPSLLLGNSNQFEDGLVQNYHPAASPVSQYTLSVTQQAYVDEYGYPDRFVIFFFDEMLPDGQLYAMRHESWYYDARGYEIVFRNGDKFTERNGAPIQIEGLGRTVYSPQGFTAEINLDALLALRGETGFFIQNVDDDLFTGELIFIQGLAAGFEEGRLSYVETLPLGEASQSAETPPSEDNSGDLTPQELAHEGAHTYEVTCTNEDGSEDNWVTVVTSEFVEGGVNRTYKDTGHPLFFQRIGANIYEYLDNGKRESIITFTDLGIQAELTNSTIASCYSLKLDGDSTLTPQELANEGTHTYEMTCVYEDGVVEKWSTVLAFEFVESGVNWKYESMDTSFFYQKIGVNTYEYLHEGEKDTLTFTDLGIQKESSSGSSCNSLRSDDSGARVLSDDILFQDDFSDTSSGWDRSEWDNGLTDYNNGVYQMVIKIPNGRAWANPGKYFEGDVRIEVDANKISGEDDNDFGVICRYNSSSDNFNYYFFIISSDGFAVIGKVIKGTAEYISSEKMEPSDAIKQGAETNHLRADCIGNRLTLYVNGEEVASITDSSFIDGDIGFITGTFDIPSSEIVFDNLIVRKP